MNTPVNINQSTSAMLIKADDKLEKPITCESCGNERARKSSCEHCGFQLKEIDNVETRP